MPGLPAKSGGGETTRIDEAPDQAWNSTVSDMMALERRLQRDGWDTVTAPAPRSELLHLPESDQIQIVHDITGNLENVLVERFQEEGGRSSCIYKSETGNWLCEVMLLLHPGKGQAVILAIMFDRMQVDGLIEGVNDGKRIVSVLKSSSGKRIAEIEHGKPGKLIPDSYLGGCS